VLFGSSLSNRCRFSHRKSCLGAGSRTSNASHVDYVTHTSVTQCTGKAGGIDSPLNELLDSVAIKPLRASSLVTRSCGRFLATASLRNPVRSHFAWCNRDVSLRLPVATDRPLIAAAACWNTLPVPQQVQSVFGPTARMYWLAEWFFVRAQRKNKKEENALCLMLPSWVPSASLNWTTTLSTFPCSTHLIDKELTEPVHSPVNKQLTRTSFSTTYQRKEH